MGSLSDVVAAAGSAAAALVEANAAAGMPTTRTPADFGRTLRDTHVATELRRFADACATRDVEEREGLLRALCEACATPS